MKFTREMSQNRILELVLYRLGYQKKYQSLVDEQYMSNSSSADTYLVPGLGFVTEYHPLDEINRYCSSTGNRFD